VEITVTNQPEQRQRVHIALEEFAGRHGVPPKVVQAADLALEEHLTNIFRYGLTPSETRPVLIRLGLHPLWLQVEVEDHGKPFNPLAQPKVDASKPLGEKPVGGLGIHLMRQFMDELEYRREGDKNVLRMKKKLQGA
jgi:anti-sigma regulatory factor (Ser/Thr protein kinase)